MTPGIGLVARRPHFRPVERMIQQYGHQHEAAAPSQHRPEAVTPFTLLVGFVLLRSLMTCGRQQSIPVRVRVLQ
jgi:hypothetical protein